MHISDGILSAPVWIGGCVAAAGITASAARRMKADDIPKIAIMASVFFVISLIHVPIGPASVHFMLGGLTGMVLGPLAPLAILLGLLLQSVLFQHGGITAVGANTIILGLPALAASWIYTLRERYTFNAKAMVFGSIAGAASLFISAILLAVFLMTMGEEFYGVTKIILAAHIPIILIESIFTGFVASFIEKVKPEILKRSRT